MALALSLLVMVLPCPVTAMLRIGAFNIQAFGDTKMSNEEVAGIIVNVSAAGDGLCPESDPKCASCGRDVWGCGHGWDGIPVPGMPWVGEGLVGTKVGCQAHPAVPLSPPWGHLPRCRGICGSPWYCTQHCIRVPSREMGGRGEGGPEPGAGSLSPSSSLSAPQILQRYDVALVQEVRDSDLSAVTQLMEHLNRYEQGRG